MGASEHKNEFFRMSKLLWMLPLPNILSVILSKFCHLEWSGFAVSPVCPPERVMPSALEEAQLCHRFSPALVGKCRNADFSKNIWGFFFYVLNPRWRVWAVCVMTYSDLLSPFLDSVERIFQNCFNWAEVGFIYLFFGVRMVVACHCHWKKVRGQGDERDTREK